MLDMARRDWEFRKENLPCMLAPELTTELQ